jgi:hypothetical protein
MFWGWDGSRRFWGAGRSGSGGFGAFGVHWVRRIWCMRAHRSWRIREPAAASQCVLSELEPKGSDKTASLLRGVRPERGVSRRGSDWLAWVLKRSSTKKPGLQGLGCMAGVEDFSTYSVRSK